MRKTIRKFLYLTTILAVLLMSAMPSYAVSADGGTEGDPPTEDPAVTTPAETPAEEAPEESLSEGAASPEEAASVEDPVEVPEILEQVPDGTDLVVINEEGEPEPLASQAAAEILVEGDPIWCPTGQVPTPNANGCTVSHAGFDDLIDDLAGGTYSGDGVIWVESNYDATEDLSNIVFNGNNGNLAALNAISVQGGWSGISGSSSIDFTNPSILDNQLRFRNWTGAVSVSNLVIQDAVINNSSLMINTDGDISIDNVTVSGNTSGRGTTLNNCLPSNGVCTGSGDVSVTDSEFNSNNNQGLLINSNGAVTIENTDADSNRLNSLQVTTDGDISLNNVTATGSIDRAGASLNNCKASAGVCTSSGDVSVVESEFNNNDTNGLTLRSAGEVTITNVTADANGSDGINVNTYNETGADVTIKYTTVTNNTQDGIQTNNTGGDLTLKEVDASNNGSEGIIINNTQGNITGSNITVNENNREGIEIDNTRGNISLSNVTANDSTLNDGVDIHNTDGNIKLSSVTAENNNRNGIEVVNVDGSLGFYCVNASINGRDGIYVSVDHDFTIKCSQSTNNVGDGLEIDSVVGSSAQLLSFTATGNSGLDINYDDTVTTVTEKTVDCSAKKESSPPKEHKGDKGLFTKLYCLPGEIKVALYDTYGDKIEFNNLCGYDAGVFDPSSWAYPETIPGGGDDYIISLQNKMLEEIPNLELNTKYGMAGILAQILDELPFMLPDGYSYASAFFTAVLDDGEYLDPLPEESGLTVRFRVPGWMDPGEELAILWWDGLDWVDLGGEYSEDGYYFQVTTEEIGVFVLAVQ